MASPECVAEIEAELGRRLQPSDLPRQHLINPSDDWWMQWFADNGVPTDDGIFRRPGVRLDSQADEGHAAMAGQGFALLTPLLWKGDVGAGRLAVPFADRVSTRGWAYWLVYPSERRTVPKVKRFREWLVGEMQSAIAQLGANGGIVETPPIARERLAS
jgi:LysR family glycine cleavage system transcriptional activator